MKQHLFTFTMLALSLFFTGELQAQHSSGEFAKEVLTFFYPGHPPTKIDETSEKLAQDMLEEALEKSRLIDRVPRPTGFKPGAGWLAKLIVQQVFHDNKASGIYEMVRVTVARNYKTAYHLSQY